MIRAKTVTIAILGTAAIIVSVLATPAMAAKGAKAQTIVKEQRHVQRRATYPSQRSSVNATMPSGGTYSGPDAGANPPATSHSFDSYTNY